MPVITHVHKSLGGNEEADRVCARIGHKWGVAPKSGYCTDLCLRCGEKGWQCIGIGWGCAKILSQSEVNAKGSYYCDECRPAVGRTDLDGDQPE